MEIAPLNGGSFSSRRCVFRTYLYRRKRADNKTFCCILDSRVICSRALLRARFYDSQTKEGLTATTKIFRLEIKKRTCGSFLRWPRPCARSAGGWSAPPQSRRRLTSWITGQSTATRNLLPETCNFHPLNVSTGTFHPPRGRFPAQCSQPRRAGCTM